jgi:hypothetical protein
MDDAVQVGTILPYIPNTSAPFQKAESNFIHLVESKFRSAWLDP